MVESCNIKNKDFKTTEKKLFSFALWILNISLFFALLLLLVMGAINFDFAGMPDNLDQNKEWQLTLYHSIKWMIFILSVIFLFKKKVICMVILIAFNLILDRYIAPHIPEVRKIKEHSICFDEPTNCEESIKRWRKQNNVSIK